MKTICPHQLLRDALVLQDLTGIRVALRAGAGVEGSATPIGHAPYVVKVPLEFVIRKHFSRVFVDVLLDAGARDTEQTRNGRFLSRSALAISLEIGNAIAVEALLARRGPGEITSSEWRACMESRKPHIWIERLLSHGAVPDMETAAMLMGKAVSSGQSRSIDILLGRVSLPVHWPAHEDIVRGGMKNLVAFRYLLGRGLQKDPELLRGLLEAGVGVLPVAIKKSGQRSEAVLGEMMLIPELSHEINMQWEGGSILQMVLESSNTRNLYPLALRAGAKFPDIKPTEEMEDYMGRLVPGLLHAIRRGTPTGLLPGMNRWLDGLWAEVQTQQMSLNTPVGLSKPARRF